MSLDIYCNATISRQMTDFFTQVVLNNLEKCDSIINVFLTTSGGTAVCGHELYNFIKVIPGNIETNAYNISSVQSAGVPFFLGFKNRYCAPGASFMIHPTTYTRDFFPERFDLSHVHRAYDNLKHIEDTTHKIIASETTLPIDSVRQHSRTETFYDAENALKFEFVKEIKAPVIPGDGVVFITDSWLATQFISNDR